MLEMFAHPFSSYCWKALIACYENEIPFNFLLVDADHSDNAQRLQTLSPQGKFPLLVDGDKVVFESSIIIEYLQHYYPGTVTLIPAAIDSALNVRTMDRFFDHYVMTPMQQIVNDFMRDPADRDATSVSDAKKQLIKSYAWLEQYLQDHTYACGDSFSMADCAAAPSLFYADWVCEIDQKYTNLRAYRACLLARPAVSRCVEAARPYRYFFPGGAPNRD